MALSYGLSLNVFLVLSVQFQCNLSNLIISVERVEQYMHIESEAPEVIEGSRPTEEWPIVGSLSICNLKVYTYLHRYQLPPFSNTSFSDLVVIFCR